MAWRVDHPWEQGWVVLHLDAKWHSATKSPKKTGPSMLELSGSSMSELSGSSMLELSGSSMLKLSGSSMLELSGSSMLELSGSSMLELSGSSSGALLHNLLLMGCHMQALLARFAD